MKWWPFGKRTTSQQPAPSARIAPPPPPPPASFQEVLEDAGLSEREDEILALIQPCIRLAQAAHGQASGRTKLGGLPALPTAEAWPSREGIALAFVAQLDLDGLPPTPDLPQHGLLSFFYDVSGESSGFSRDDVGGWKVLHVTSEASPRSFPANLPEAGRFAEVPLVGTVADSFPDPEAVNLNVSRIDEDDLLSYEDAYEEFVEAAIAPPRHQALGYPFWVSEPIMLAAHRYSHGSVDMRKSEMKRGAREWRLLLQVDSDLSADMSWWDDGILHFCIRREDLKAANFANVWLCVASS